MQVAALHTLPHFIPTQILGTSVKSILQIKWLGKVLDVGSGSVTGPTTQLQQANELPIWMPYCPLTINKLQRNIIISLPKKVSSSNVPKVKSMDILKCLLFHLSYVSPFLLFYSYCYQVSPPSTQDFSNSKISESCVPLWFIIWRATDLFYLHVSCMTLLLCSKT